MRIRTRLQINVILAIVIAIALGSILFIAVKVLNEGSKRERIATEIVKGMAELKTITNEYLLHPGEQAQMQWQIKYNSLSKLLTGEQFKIPEEKIILDKILYNHTRVKNTFVELVTIYEKEQGLSKGKEAITWELEDRLTALLLVSLQAMDSAAFQLHDAIQADLVTAQKIANLLIIAFLVILTVLILTTSLWINRSVVKPIAKFEKVIAIIGSGNLDYKAGKATKDEIGQLSRAFKQMTEKLKITTVSRDELSNYFIEHKQVEEALQESEGQFRQLTENIREVFWMSSPDGNRMIYTSPAYEEVWGRKPRTLYEHPKSWLDAIHPKDRERVITAFFPEQMIQGKYDGEFRVVRPDGSVRWVWARGFPIRNRLGDVYRIAGIAEDITERKKVNEQINKSLREKEILLREIHHRVKNNMQVIISLLMLQSEKIKDKQILEFFKESKNRIKSMALIHEKFYQSKNFVNIDLNGYVKTFVTNLFKSYGINTSKISHKIKIEDVSLGLEDAIPCGLIINELVSNALKYAFPQDRKGEIRVAFRSINEDELELTVSDNGIGIPEDLDFRNTESLGLHLVTILAEDQLDGKIELNRKVGTEYRIRFSKSMYKVRSIEK